MSPSYRIVTLGRNSVKNRKYLREMLLTGSVYIGLRRNHRDKIKTRGRSKGRQSFRARQPGIAGVLVVFAGW